MSRTTHISVVPECLLSPCWPGQTASPKSCRNLSVPAVLPCLVAFRLQVCFTSWRSPARLALQGLPVAIAVDVHQVVADFMSIAADDLHRTESAELRMVDQGLARCSAGDAGPLSCRRPQEDQADSW
jgi:hypothetical protein